MSMLDNLSGTAKKYLGKASVKAGEVVESSKLYLDKTQATAKLSSLYEKLGRAHYATDTNQRNEGELIQSLMQQIHDLEEEVSQLDSQIFSTKAKKCPFCGKKNPAGSSFCESCGQKID